MEIFKTIIGGLSGSVLAGYIAHKLNMPWFVTSALGILFCFSINHFVMGVL